MAAIIFLSGIAEHSLAKITPALQAKQTLQLARKKKIWQKVVSTSKKIILLRGHRFFAAVLSEMGG